MQIHGMNALTLLDYSDKLACVLFTPGCQMCCPFCHNAALAAAPAKTRGRVTPEEVLSMLEKRRNLLEGVCVSGGEPLLQPDLDDMLRAIKALGLAVKLDTNGLLPGRLARLISDGLIDCIAMDVKNSPERYAETCGMESIDRKAIGESIRLIQSSGLPHEFRTTVVRELHSAEDLAEISQWNLGDSLFFLQSFRDSAGVRQKGLHAYSPAEMEAFRDALTPLLPNVRLRG